MALFFTSSINTVAFVMDSNDFRTLQCGHCFCIKCLQILYDQDGKIICPMDRKEDVHVPNKLPKPHQFRGQLYLEAVVDSDFQNINDMFDDMIRCRKQTISHLQGIARELETHEYRCAGAKIGGSAAGIVGGILGAIGLSLSLTGIGAVVGVPLGVAGGGLAAAGGITSAGAIVVEATQKKLGIDKIQADLQNDYFNAQRMRILICRAATDNELAQKWQSATGFDLGFLGGLITNMAKLGVTTTIGLNLNFTRAATLGVGRAAAVSGLHIAGLVFAAVLIPVDVVQMIISSIRIHKNKPSKVIEEIIDIANTLETQMKVSLIDGGYFRLVYTQDHKWCYVVLYATMKMAFENLALKDIRMQEIDKYGEVLVMGEGTDVPKKDRRQIHQEWYSHHETYCD